MGIRTVKALEAVVSSPNFMLMFLAIFINMETLLAPELSRHVMYKYYIVYFSNGHIKKALNLQSLPEQKQCIGSKLKFGTSRPLTHLIKSLNEKSTEKDMLLHLQVLLVASKTVFEAHLPGSQKLAPFVEHDVHETEHSVQ